MSKGHQHEAGASSAGVGGHRSGCRGAAGPPPRGGRENQVDLCRLVSTGPSHARSLDVCKT